MKFFKHSVSPVDVSFIKIVWPVRYGEEDIPNDFPLRVGNTWTIVVDIETGQIQDWPGLEQETTVHMKVVDEGVYFLLNNEKQIVASLENEYVPHGIVPGEWGDYIILELSETGKIKNWKQPDDLDLWEFNLKRGDEI